MLKPAIRVRKPAVVFADRTDTRNSGILGAETGTPIRRVRSSHTKDSGKRGVEAADYAASAISGRWGAAQFHGMSSSQRDAGHPSAIFAMTSPI